MTFPPRVVVTGSDADVEPELISRREGHRSTVVWTTGGEFEPGERAIPGGTVFRIAEFSPGVASARHRTETVDYGVVVSGEIDLVLDDKTLHLSAGDVFVQCGTWHDWVNNGEEPCVIAFCLVGTPR
ncbi:MAG TPA: cupin domain-containing protein [Gaiellaceae bacterium]|nr:cupin domain-containing protein [Gaiellaceae bacterium]